MVDDSTLRERAQQFIKYGTVTEKNVEQLRKLNLAVFPVRYNDKFYTDMAASPVQDYTHLAYFSDILEGSKFKIYIMTIGVLAPYRRLGIGTTLLQLVLDACSRQADCEQIYLHVQVGNQDAIDFYTRFGFTVGDVVKDYYKRIEPTDAVLLSRDQPFPALAEKPPSYA